MNTFFKQKKGLYAITDCDAVTRDELLEKTEQVLKAGTKILQYRDKKNNYEEKLSLAQKLNDLCQAFQAVFIMNDDIELAKKVNADGVHIGKGDGDLKTIRSQLGNKIIGVSCYNNLQLAIEAEENSADYIAFGSFYPSRVKPNAVKAEIELLQKAKTRLKIPIVAIGGITPENGANLISSGADNLAVISGLYKTNDSFSASKAYLDLF